MIARGLAVACVLVAGTLASASESLFSVSATDGNLRLLNPVNGATFLSTPITGLSGVVDGGDGLAVHPVTQEMYAILQVSGLPDPVIAIVDPFTAVASEIGPMSPGFADLAFDCNGTLFAVSGDGAPIPESLWEVSLVDGSVTFLCELGRGDDGETIGFNFADQMLYHASGHLGPYDPVDDSGVIFERIAGGVTDPCSATDIPISGTALVDEEVQALTWWEELGVFLWKQDHSPGPLYRVTPDGVVTLGGQLDHQAKGLAFVPPPLCTASPTTFRRGDCNDDDNFDISDPVFQLSVLFVMGSPPALCEDACDTNDDGALDISDPVYGLSSLFVPGSPSPTAPHPACGADPTADALGCGAFSACP